MQTRSNRLRCFCCKTKSVICSGCKERLFRSVPIGSKPVLFRAKVQRLKCKSCGVVRQENTPFTTGKSVYTHKLANLVIELSRIGTIKDLANFLHLSWDTVKEIQKKYLKRQAYGYRDQEFFELKILALHEKKLRSNRMS